MTKQMKKVKKEVATSDDFSPAEVGKIIFEGKITSCHNIDSKLIDP
jgi:cytochrome c551/c552